MKKKSQKKGINQHSITYSKQPIFFLSFCLQVSVLGVLHVRYFPIEPLFLPGCLKKAAASGDEDEDEEKGRRRW